MNPQQNDGGGRSAPAQSPYNPMASPFAPPVLPANEPSEAATQSPTKPADPMAILKLPSNVAVADTSSASNTPTSNAIGTDDGDLIEKEWVDKAKQIVEHYRDDPYNQSKQMTIFRADYMKKRYNRTIKLGE